MLKKHRYKEKKCPMCGLLHKKRWDCCSRECGIAFRSLTPVSEETKRSISEGVKKWKMTPEGENTNVNLLGVTQEDELVIPPFQDHDMSGFVEDGDVWVSA